MLRYSFLTEIHKKIEDSHYFDRGDFEVNVPQSGLYNLVIKYRFEDKYRFQAKIPDKISIKLQEHFYKFECSMAPGEMTTQEKMVFESKREFLNGIDSWLHRVYAELTAAPILRDIEKWQEELEKILTTVEELPEAYFTVDEGEQVKKDLSNLEQEMIENLQKHEDEIADFNGQIRQLREDFQMLRDTVYSMNKRNWTGSVLVRVKNWLAVPQNRNLLKSGAKFAFKLLPDKTVSDWIDEEL